MNDTHTQHMRLLWRRGGGSCNNQGNQTVKSWGIFSLASAWHHCKYKLQ